jgi:enamine deaminase RidA (YjgF/YER057c/UK114 family)
VGIERLSPPGLSKPAAYTQVVVAQGRRMVFVAGQVSIDAGGKLVAPGDFAGQVKQVFANLRTALDGAGATP